MWSEQAVQNGHFAEAAEGCGKEAISKEKEGLFQAWSPYLGERLRGNHADDLPGADQEIPVKITFPRKVITAIRH